MTERRFFLMLGASLGATFIALLDGARQEIYGLEGYVAYLRGHWVGPLVSRLALGFGGTTLVVGIVVAWILSKEGKKR